MRDFFIYSSLFLSGLVFGQNTKVELSINPVNMEVGEVFSITISSSVAGSFELENLPTSFIQDYSIHQGSTQEMDYNTGEVNVLYFMTYTGIITKAGDYTIGPAWVKSGNKSYNSNKVDVKVSKKMTMSSGNVTVQQLNDPAFGVIECNKKEVYEGEPLLVSAKVYSSYDPTHISGYQSYQVNSTALKHPIGNSNEIKVLEEKFKGKKLNAFSYDKNVIFPDAVGIFQIEPFKMNLHQNYKSFPITSSGLKIKVKPLPANPPSDFIGGVGTFDLKSSIESTSIKQGDVIKLTLTISGIGNLHNLIEPVLLLPKGFVVYGDPVPTENFSISSKGAEGEVSYEYNIQITKYGKLILPACSISYFDPEKEKYVQLLTKDLEIDVKKNASFRANDTKTVEESTSEMIVHNTSIRTEREIVKKKELFGKPVFWTGVGLPLMSALLLVLFRINRRKNGDSIRRKEKLRERKTELNEQLDRLKHLSNGTDDDTFLILLEQSIRLAVAIQLQVEDSATISKNSILDYLKDRKLDDAESRVRNLFAMAEKSRYSFAMDSDLNKAAMYEELLNIIQKIRE